MGCLDIKPTVKNITPKYHILKNENKTGSEDCFYRNHFRVYYVTKGYLTVAADGESLRLGFGDICIVPPNVQHSTVVNTDHACVSSFSFSIDFVDNILENQAGTSGVLSKIFNTEKLVLVAPIPPKMQIHLSHLMEFMSYEYEDDLDCADLILSNSFATVLCIFLGLLKKQREELSSYNRNGILYAINYVKQNYSQRLTPMSVARLINMSEKTFITTFKSFSGHTFHDFLNKVRIEKAVELIRAEGDNISLSNLAYVCGYDSYTTFYRNFIKHTGSSPTELCGV